MKLYREVIGRQHRDKEGSLPVPCFIRRCSTATYREQEQEFCYDASHDEDARNECGWQPQFGTIDAIIDKFTLDVGRIR